MPMSAPESIESLLTRDLPRELVLAVQASFDAGAQLAHDVSKNARSGHKAHVVGMMRHFQIGEAFYDALEATGGQPTPLRGNALVIGKAGMFNVARMSIKDGPWYNARRSVQRRALAELNRTISQLVQPDLFGERQEVPTKASVFFVAIFAKNLAESPERPVDIQIAVPDPEMRTWLYTKSVTEFLQCYSKPAEQVDKAKPALKANRTRKQSNEGGTSS